MAELMGHNVAENGCASDASRVSELLGILGKDVSEDGEAPIRRIERGTKTLVIGV
jgi:hypothetical protein